MPVKKRRSKMRVDPLAEAQAWACAFETGHDFFGDLEDFGIVRDPLTFGGGEDDMHAAMPDAWRRLGRLYLDHRLGEDFNRTDYALSRYGEPESCR